MTDKIQQHELTRVRSMTDNELHIRYGKMNKPDKIRAFFDTLIKEDRAIKLRETIANDHGFVLPTDTTEWVAWTLTSKDGVESIQFSLVFTDEKQTDPTGEIFVEEILPVGGRFSKTYTTNEGRKQWDNLINRGYTVTDKVELGDFKQ